jgi:hypothetical protein
MLGPQADFSMLLFKIEMHGHSIAKIKFPSGILSNPSLMEFGNASRPKVFPSKSTTKTRQTLRVR